MTGRTVLIADLCYTRESAAIDLFALTSVAAGGKTKGRPRRAAHRGFEQGSKLKRVVVHQRWSQETGTRWQNRLD